MKKAYLHDLSTVNYNRWIGVRGGCDGSYNGGCRGNLGRLA